MYSNQQQPPPHSSSRNYQQQNQDTPGHPSHASGVLRHPPTFSRSSSVSSAVNYQQLPSEGYDNGNMHYNQTSVYDQDMHYHYTTSPHATGHPVSSFQQPAGHRSASDGMAYTIGSRELDRTAAFGDTAGHPGSARARTMSLSYAQQRDLARHPSSPEYTQHNYIPDSRYAPQQLPYPPPSSYRGGAASPTMTPHSLSRPVPTRMNSTPLSHQVSLPQPPPLPHGRRGSSASSTSGSHKLRTAPLEPGSGASVPANQPRPHVCDICGLAFVRGHDLKRHKDTHTNSKPHVCECGKSFSRKDALKRHIHLKSCRGEKPGGGYATSEE